MLHRSWYTQEVSVVAPRWVDVDGPFLRPQGRDVLTVGSKAYRSLRNPTLEENLKPSVEPLPSGSSFVRDTGELAHRISQGRQLWHELELSRHPWAEAEREQARKITLQRGGPPGWWVQLEGMIIPATGSMREAFAAVASSVLAIPPPTHPLPTRYKLGTSHGWPDYSTSNLSYVLHGLWAAHSGLDWDAFVRFGARLASAMDQSDTPFSSIMYNRAGPLGKPVAGYDTEGLDPRQLAELTGLCCRRRVVHGMTSAGNMAQKASADQMKYRMYHFPQFYHPGGAASIANKVRAWATALPDAVVFSDDITAFDQHVRPNHQDEMIAAFYPDEPKLAEFKRQWKDSPLLSPAIRGGREAFLYTRSGGTPSGAIDTALDGSRINIARILMCVGAATGRTPAAVWAGRGVWWDCLILGDDTLIAVPRWAKMDKYIATSVALGYPTKLSNAMVFLMHHFALDGSWAPLAARVFQQTVFNEYGGGSMAAELLAWIERTGLGFRANPWAGRVFGMLADGEAFLTYGVRPDNAIAALRNPKFVADLRHAVRTDATSRRRVVDVWERTNNPLLSEFVSHLITPQDAPLDIGLDPERAALDIAAYMGHTEDEREEHHLKLPSYITEAISSLFV